MDSSDFGGDKLGARNGPLELFGNSLIDSIRVYGDYGYGESYI